MLLASFLFAVQAAFVKLAGTDVGALEFVFYRGVFGMVIIGLWAYFTGHTVKTRYLWSQLNRGFYGTGGMWLWLYSLAYLPIGTSMTLNNTSPLFMAAILLGLGLFRGKKIEWELTLATVIGFIGVIFILQPEFREGDFFPASMGLLSGFLGALAYFQIKQLARMREPSWRVVFYFSMFNLVFGLIGHTFFENPSLYNVKTIGCIVGTGLTATLAQVCMTKAYAVGNLLLSALLQFSGIIFGCIIGLIFFSDSLGFLSSLGILIIIAAGTGASVITKRKPAAPDE
ncbi:MAG: DMT family transporter [Burkholderiales bacterium]|nr:DMT family transporter [Burkholderiales bacterium]